MNERIGLTDESLRRVLASRAMAASSSGLLDEITKQRASTPQVRPVEWWPPIRSLRTLRALSPIAVAGVIALVIVGAAVGGAALLRQLAPAPSLPIRPAVTAPSDASPTASRRPRPTITPTGVRDGRVVVARSGDLYIGDSDGDTLQTLTSGTSVDRDPAWSPNGGLIAFSRADSATSDADLYVIASDGSGLRPLTAGDPDDQAPTWAADGSRLLFLRTTGGNRQIAIVDLAGTAVQTVPTAGRLPIGVPDWSPDGSAVVFAATEPATPTMDVYVQRIDGTGGKLTDDLDRKLAPAWSPDGSSIAFGRGGGGATAPARSLSTVDLAGQERSLTGPIGITALDWSPDGRWILVTIEDDSMGGRLAIVDVASGGLDVVATLQDLPERARWSPDGSRIAVLVTNAGGEHMWLVGPSDGSDLQPIAGPIPNALAGSTLGLDWERLVP